MFRAAFILLALLCLPTRADTALLDKIRDAARRSSLDPKLVQAIIKKESNFDPRARSPKGAEGLMQVMPVFADECGILAPYHTVNHLMEACRCLRALINRYRGNLELALAAYNAGPGNVARYGGIPPFEETQQYVKGVLELYRKLKSEGGASDTL